MKTCRIFLILLLAAVLVGCNTTKEATLAIGDIAGEYNAAGETTAFTVYSNTLWTAVIRPDIDWLHLSVTSGNGDTEIRLTIDANPTQEPRTGTIAVYSGELEQHIAINQGGNQPYLTVTPSQIFVSYTGDTAQAFLTTNLTWTAIIDANAANWCTIAPLSGTGNSTFTIVVSENKTATERAGTITISAGTHTASVEVIQTDTAPIIVNYHNADPVCGLAGLIAVSATANAGNVVDWYNSPIGGEPLTKSSNTYSVSISTPSTFYAEARNPNTGDVSASRQAVTAEIYPEFKAGAIKAGTATTDTGVVPTATIEEDTPPTGGLMPYYYEWRRNDISQTTATNPNYTFVPDDVASEGTYTYVRYVKDSVCTAGAWVPSGGSFTLVVTNP